MISSAKAFSPLPLFPTRLEAEIHLGLQLCCPLKDTYCQIL